jgi:predicted SnoaL-like aldol condensation-catalyzing enzyme
MSAQPFRFGLQGEFLGPMNESKPTVPKRGVGRGEVAQGTDQTTGERSQSMTSTPTVNATTVRSFLELTFNGRQPAEAAATYLASSYRMHAPWGHEYVALAWVRYVESYLRTSPDLRLTIQLVIAEGDLVVTQSLFQRDANDSGRQVTDTFELANGRIVCHLDVMRDLPENLGRVARAA